MNVTLKQLRGFVAIAELGSFAEACERLHLSQPALSIAIRNMEEAVGGQLLARSTRAVELTPEGEEFLPVAQRLLSDWTVAFDDLHRLFSLQRGKLTIAAMPSFASTYLPAVLADYRQQYSNINIAVQDVVMEHVIQSVQMGRVDLGITFEPDVLENVEFQPLFDDRFVAVLPMEHVLSERKRLTFRQLLTNTLVVLNRGSSTRYWTDQAIEDVGIEPPQLFEASQLTTVGAMVAAGVGVAIVPSICRDQMQRLGAVCRPVSGACIERRVGILTRRRHSLSSAAQQMIRLLEKHTSATPKAY